MKTLDEFNDDRWRHHMALDDMNKPHPNGIACPKCGAELWDSNPMMTLTSNPPKENVHCESCDYRGYRIA